jgi:hypothetical protein
MSQSRVAQPPDLKIEKGIQGFWKNRRADGHGGPLRDPDALMRVPIFREAIINGRTYESARVKFADDRVFDITYANSRWMRFLFRHGIVKPTIFNSQFWEMAHEPKK